MKEIARLIEFGGRRGFISYYLSTTGNKILYIGPFLMIHFTKRFHCWLLPWRSKTSGSIFWLRFCFGLR